MAAPRRRKAAVENGATDEPSATLDAGVFKIGDVVQLKSGGFPMTIVAPACRDHFQVMWCSRTLEGLALEERYLPAAALKLREKPDFDDDIPF